MSMIKTPPFVGSNMTWVVFHLVPSTLEDDVDVEPALNQEPELITSDLVGTLLCARSHVCEPVVEGICKLCGYHAKVQGQLVRSDHPVL